MLSSRASDLRLHQTTTPVRMSPANNITVILMAARRRTSGLGGKEQAELYQVPIAEFAIIDEWK